MPVEFMEDHVQTKKPPLGLKPKWVHDYERKCEILDAMERYSEVNFPIPKEWITELRELIKSLS